MVSVLAFRSSSWVCTPVKSTKDYKIGILCFTAKYAAIKSKRKDWLAQNQNNMPEWNDRLPADGVLVS
jgi:hypothetical protein